MNQVNKDHSNTNRFQIVDLLLVVVILAAGFLRLNGLFWGENQYLHPDERFLVWVGTDISPVESISEYFDTANSSLNPHNRGHGFYVYGTLPMFITRYIVEWVYGHSGFAEMTQAGRSLSALVDLLTVILVYLIAARVYNRSIAILAAAFSALAVLQIQQSHFFTMDTFINFFTFLALYFAITIAADNRVWDIPYSAQDSEEAKGSVQKSVSNFFTHPLFLPSLGFGLALGMAAASKLNAAPMALMLPAALLIRLMRFPVDERKEFAFQAFWYLVTAAGISLAVFRILQPYAFSGPGLFNLRLNPQWVANIRELRAQSSGDVDFPPAMQWARRSFWFSGKNLILWGLGLPLGITAWAGFIWVGWKILKSVLEKTLEWHKHILIWGWTALYFIWQSSSLNPSMRYQLPIYPTLAILAAWFIVTLYLHAKSPSSNQEQVGEAESAGRMRGKVTTAAVVFLGILVLSVTFLYAFAFSGIYSRQITRIQASRWIYENIPGPINLRIKTGQGTQNLPLPYPYELSITPGLPFSKDFEPTEEGFLTEVYLPNVINYLEDHEKKILKVSILDSSDLNTTLATSSIRSSFSSSENAHKGGYHLKFESPVKLERGKRYQLLLEMPGESAVIKFPGDITLGVKPLDAASNDEIWEQHVNAGETSLDYYKPLTIQFNPTQYGALEYILIAADSSDDLFRMPLSFLSTMTAPGEQLTIHESDISVQASPDGRGMLLILENPFPLIQGEDHILNLQLTSAGGAVGLQGKGIANEGEWDDGLPLRIDGFDGFGGIYPLDLNFNMYWEDNPEKAGRFVRILDEADYIVISSSRQWGSLPRIPERFPLVTRYYRQLMGCPQDRSIEWCYNVAQPGSFEGNLGFDLVKVFQSNPAVGSLSLNDQFAEEAFTVYDHPKVLIFKKNERFLIDQVREILETVDYTEIVRLPPMKYPSQPATLMLPDPRLAEQRQNGTWSELFDPAAMQNRYPVLSLLIWYLAVAVIGLVTYPILRLACSSLADRGYPLSRITGMLILSYLVWLAGSLRIPFSRTTISIALGFMITLGTLLAYRYRKELKVELRDNSGYFLKVELLVLAFFAAFLLVRIGNPDLWHPWKGGEKPMDFAYFNAVLKSTTFPPFDPWFAGGYLHYYYYGFVLTGVLVKWLGITPSIAYNLILPTIFSMIAMGAFSLAWNLYSSNHKRQQIPGGGSSQTLEDMHFQSRAFKPQPIWVGLAGAFAMAVLGNLGAVRMILVGYQKLVAPGGIIEGKSLLTRGLWTVQGFIQSITGASLPYGIGDWYWLPSRIIPAQGDVEPITEFPYFTVLYGDPHAHLFALPISLLVLTLCLAFVLSKTRWANRLGIIAIFVLSALSIGALRPTNTADFYPYLILGAICIGYLFLRYSQWPGQISGRYPVFARLPITIMRIVVAAVAVLLLVSLTELLYIPYSTWSDFGYGELDLWQGSRTPLYAYLTHWGLFLFTIISWMIWESIHWMASTPLSSMRKLNPYKLLIVSGIFLLAVSILGLTILGVQIAWFVLPLAAWAGILLLRPDTHDSKRFVLFLIGTGLVLTLVVEIVVVVGDIGRMNTVFKFYLQVWTMFAVSAAAAFGWTLAAIAGWKPGWQRVWQIGFLVLVTGTALYPIMATAAKVKDRMAPDAPHALDGMTYMNYATYAESWGVMDLSQDYQAIRWMMENVSGSPVIVEANLRNLYRWGSRFSNYTGLPGVVGWEWHQQQQRTSVPGSWISERIAEVDDFYNTTDLEQTKYFLRKYDVRYIILGQQERGHYPGSGLEKFEAAEGVLWDEVYRDGDTVIYEVIEV